MSSFFQILLCFLLLEQAYSYKECYIYHNHGGGSTKTVTKVSCSNAHYCCDKGCCRKVYTIWYFWTLLLFGLFMAVIFCWWYKAHQRRQQLAVVRRNVIPMQIVQSYPMNNQHSGPINQREMPHYPVYPIYPYAPPPYTVAVNQPPPNCFPPGQMPPPAVARKP